jgi:ATP-dependent protease ClpP protease subunit
MPKVFRSPVFVSIADKLSPALCRSLTSFVEISAARRCREIHLEMNTSGGDFEGAISVYEALRQFPGKVCAHNVGRVDSMGVVVFLAAS